MSENADTTKPVAKIWRVGSKVLLNVYDGDRPVCQCHNPTDAAHIVHTMNHAAEVDADRAYLCRAGLANEWEDRFQIQNDKITEQAETIREQAEELKAMEEKIADLEDEKAQLMKCSQHYTDSALILQAERDSLRETIRKLREALIMSADHWDDLATIIDRDSSYTNTGFLRASGKRCRDAALADSAMEGDG